MEPTQTASIWARAIADPVFRDALIDDPLRALADTEQLDVSADQVRQLEEMSRAEREDLLRELLREVAGRRARQVWGERFWTPDEPGGPQRPPESDTPAD